MLIRVEIQQRNLERVLTFTIFVWCNVCDVDVQYMCAGFHTQTIKNTASEWTRYIDLMKNSSQR